MVTLRVYDSAATNKEFTDSVDRFSLYVPTPRNKVREWGIMGMFLGFSFGKETITRCCWDECRNGVAAMNLGRKVKRDTLPLHVQKWVDKMEKFYNRALKENTIEAWEDWYRI